jgi:hypothetical protein
VSEPEAEWQRIDFEDIWWTLCFQVVGEHWMNWRLYEIASPDGPMWSRAGSNSHPDMVTAIGDAQVALEGHVKWDACWEINQEDFPLHFCAGYTSLLRLAKALERVLNVALDQLAAADSEMFEAP